MAYFASTKSEDKLTTLDEYIARAAEGQKAIYFITGDDENVLANNPQLEAFKEKGIEVLLRIRLMSFGHRFCRIIKVLLLSTLVRQMLIWGGSAMRTKLMKVV